MSKSREMGPLRAAYEGVVFILMLVFVGFVFLAVAERGPSRAARQRGAR